MKLIWKIKNLLFLNLIVIVVFLIGLMAVFPKPVIAEENTPEWSYAGAANPTHWGEISPDFALCELGKNQSPININNAVEATPVQIEFNYQPTPLLVVNNGYTVQVNYHPGSTMKINDEEYELIQFHFHIPSEHTINNKASALEMHLVHRNAKNQLAVVGVMMNKGSANPFIDQIWQHITAVGKINDIENYTINAANLLPKNKAFFSYIGSLTTPPCSENVKWNVLTQATQVSEKQIAAFQKLYQVNARPVQPINTRKIEFHPS